MTPPADDLPCSLFVELVTEYLDGALDGDDRQRLDDHLATCGGCTTVLEQFRTVIRTTGALGEDDVSSIASKQRDEIMQVFRDWAATRPY